MTEEWTQIQPYLRPGERVLWAGRPDPRVRLAPGDALAIPFSIIWCSFVAFWEASAFTSGAPLFFRLWGVPFVLVGLYMLVGRFVVKGWRKRRTVYAVTDERVLVAVGARYVADAPVAGLPMTTRLSRDGQHTNVVLGPTGVLGWTQAMYANTGLDILQRRPTGQLGLFDVREGRAMLTALDQARRSRSAPNS